MLNFFSPKKLETSDMWSESMMVVDDEGVTAELEGVTNRMLNSFKRSKQELKSKRQWHCSGDRMENPAKSQAVYRCRACDFQ